jgi:ABC-type microcin C transport system duplicated ATPase subunit YejF
MDHKQRKVTILANGVVELFPPADNPGLRERIDHGDTLSFFQKIITNLSQKSMPKIIGVEGKSGVGKSILAELLTETGNNTVLVSMKGKAVTQKVDLPVIPDKMATFIFDDPSFITDSSLQEYIEMIIEGDGCAIFITRSLDDLPDSVLKSMVRLSMDRNSVKVLVKSH